MGFNLGFKGLTSECRTVYVLVVEIQTVAPVLCGRACWWYAYISVL